MQTRQKRLGMNKTAGSYNNFVFTTLALAVVWAIWNESLSLNTLSTGVALGGLSIFVTNRFLLLQRFQHRYHIGILTALKYVAVLIIEIFRSGIHAIHITLTDRINVGVVDFPSHITDPVIQVLVANAITLTPGTVTIDIDQGYYKVVWIDCVTSDPETAGEMIKGSFERVFRRAANASPEVES